MIWDGSNLQKAVSKGAGAEPHPKRDGAFVRSGGDTSTAAIFRGYPSTEKMRDDLWKILERISFLREYGSFNREYDESACIWDFCIS